MEIEVDAYALADVLHERVVEVFLEFVEFVEKQEDVVLRRNPRRGDVVAHAGRRGDDSARFELAQPANTVSRERR